MTYSKKQMISAFLSGIIAGMAISYAIYNIILIWSI